MDFEEFASLNKFTAYKSDHFFPIYRKHFSKFKDPIKFLEIGVAEGSSLAMWSHYFHPNSTIVGIDINPNCGNPELTNVHVRIGDQKDKNFLKELVKEFGTFDIVLDDGSHNSKDILETFHYLYPRISSTGCYLVEDTHKTYIDGLDNPKSFMNYVKNLLDQMSANSPSTPLPSGYFDNSTFCISCYYGIVAFNKEPRWK